MFWIGAIVIAVIGTLLHFIYEWSSHSKFVALFAAVNESTWEHIKICMTPTLLWSLYDGYVYGLNSNYWIGKSLSLLVIILLIPILFYTYTIFTKKAVLVIDVICFYLTVFISQQVFYYCINLDALPFIVHYFSCILLFIEISAYLLLTYNPFKNFIFKDPITKKYGLAGHSHEHHHDHHEEKK